MDPKPFLDTEILHYRLTKTTEVAECALLSGCEVTKLTQTTIDKCYSTKNKKHVSCPVISSLRLPELPKQFQIEGQAFEVVHATIADNKKLGFASVPIRRVDALPNDPSIVLLLSSRDGDANWKSIAPEDTCLDLGGLGPEARYFNFYNPCGEAGAWIQFLGSDFKKPIIGNPVSKDSLPAMVAYGIISQDSNRYSRSKVLPSRDQRQAIAIFEKSGVEIDVIYSP